MEMQAKLRVNKDLAKSASAENVNTSYIGYNSNEGDNIKVYVRIRPPHKQIIEGSTDQSICLEVTSPQSLTIATKPEPKQFSYDYVAHMETTQEEVFATVGKGIIEAFVNGFNGTIFAYGQTGSGKTFTMLGPADDTDNFSHELRGVIPRGFEYLFSLINREQEKAGDRVEFLARCSFLEIYNEQVFDLLEPSTASLHLRENMKKGVFVEGLAERDVTSAKDAYDVLQSGWSNRRVASTSMNRESSRSHAVFTVTLESKKRSGGMNNIKISKLHLVDLAGSERQKDTQTADLRLKEAGSINKSLSALGNVIMSLVDIAHGKNRHIHYRDSKLTFILRDSLGGNAKTYIIANVHPSSRCFGETLSTLNFARRAKMIKNKAFINEDVSGNVSELQAEIRKLKELLAQAKAGIAPEASSSSSTETSNSGSKGTLSEDGLQWKDMMLNAISERDQSEIEKNSLQEKVLKLEELCSKKDKFYHSTKMILKFRNDAIAKLQRQLKKELGPQEEDGKDKEIKLLKEEIKLLAANIENHPDVKKFAFENLELRKEIKRLKQHDHAELSKQLAEKSRYTLQLERKLRESFTFKSNDLEKSLSSSQQSLDASNAEIEKLKMELVQIQAKLDTSQNDLLQSRHAFQEQSEQLVSLKESGRKKELELQSDLAAFRKSNNELERTLEAFQLRTAVERTAMNSLHIQTIKTLSSPRKFGTPQKNRLINTSKQSTPIKTVNGSDEKQTVNGVKTGACARSDSSKDRNRSLQTTSDYGEYVNDLNRLLEDEPPPKSLQRKDSLNDITDDEDDTSPFWKSVNETRDDEIVYLEALQDEIKHLQNLHSEAIANLYKEQKSKIPMVESVAKLEHKVQDLDKLLCNERSSWSAKEADLTSQLTVLRDNYKEAQGSATILKSEVDDLRIHLQVTEKQFASLKKDKTEEILEIEGRITVLESKNVKLEIDNMNLRNEVDATAETNNNLQANYEESQEELEFTRHKSNELEKILLLERKKIKELEEELQAVAEKLNNEIEARMKLTQEDTEQELVKSFETINVLREELNAIAKKSAEQAQEIAKLSSDLERARSDAATQKWMNLKDKDAINKFMARVDEYTKTIAEKDFAISSMTSELDDVKEQYERSVQSCEEKKKKIQKLTEALQAESEKLLKEKLDREKEVTGLAEEIQTAQDQCKELQENLYEQRAQLEFLREDHLNAKKTIAEQKNIVLLLEEEKQNLKKTESSELFDDSIVYVENHEIDEAKKQLLDVTRLTDTYKANEVEFKKEIADLQRRFSEYEIIETKKDELEERGKILEEEIEHLEQENTQLKERLLNMDKEISVERVEIEGIKNSLQQARNSQKQAEIEKLEAEQKLSALEMNMFNVQDDLEATQEELEKTKALEEKYFEEANRLRSKLESADEEKTRFEQQIEQLIKAKEALELEKSRLYGHRNHNQKIEYVTNLKKENNSLKEQIQKVLMSVNKMESCDRCRQRNENIIESAPIKC